ncbi:MAG: hypothetical protein ACLFTB_01080 [Desulfovibrionales bacterium]
MSNPIRSLSLVFAAGIFGGLVNGLVVWLFGKYGITGAFGVRMAPALTPGWLYPRLVWGGVWGLLFLLPLLRSRTIARGLVLSLGPTLVMLFIVFPYEMHQGMLGLRLGMLTPVFVLLFNAFWGVAAATWLRLSR